MGTNTPESQLLVARRMYATAGIPPRALLAMGNFGKQIRKGPTITDDQNRRVNGDGFVRITFQDLQGGNSGSSFESSFENAVPDEFDQFVVPVGEHWGHFKTSNKANELTKAGGMQGNLTNAQRMDGIAEDWWVTLSSTFWTDGTGRFGLLDGSAQVGGNVITLKNRSSIHKFRRGMLLAMTAPGAIPLGVLATKRAGTPLRVKSINRNAGTMVITDASGGATTISGEVAAATDGDYLVPWSFYPTANETSELLIPTPITGVFAYCPLTTTEANGTVYNVDGSVDPELRRGQRVALGANVSEGDVVATLAEYLGTMPVDVTGNHVGTMWQPLHKIPSLHQAMTDQQVTRVESPEAQANDPKAFQLGMKSVTYQFTSGHRLQVVSDRMLCDMDSTVDEDETRVITLEGQWSFPTTASSINWQMGGDGKMLRQVTGSSSILAAPYGTVGQLVPRLPGNNLVMSRRALD